MAEKMEHSRERRVPGVRRVPVDRIVDICTSVAPTSAFQARSVDVSGRGMHVRSKHLPELSAPLVLRFQEHGAEIIAEGEVVWRSPHGGDFGVRFTALDSRSVQALKALCQSDAQALSGPSEGKESEEHDTEPAPEVSAGVHLHIAGLPTPMRAAIRGTHQRRLEVGSPLEFLRVGQSLEVEDLGQGGRRGARIDAVDVAVDGLSRVPELVVSVRYADVPDTPLPAPTRVVSARQPLAPSKQAEPSDDAASSAPPATEPAGAEARDAELPRVVEALGARDSESDEMRDSAPDVTRDSAPDDLRKSEPGGMRDSEPDDRRDSESDDTRDSEPGGELLASSGDAPESDPFDDDEAPAEPEPLRERLESVLAGLSAAARVAGRQCRSAGDAASRGARLLVARARGAADARARRVAPLRRTAAAPSRGHSARAPSRLPAGTKRSGREAPPTRSPRRQRLVGLGGLVASATLLAVLLGRGQPTPETGSAAPNEKAPSAGEEQGSSPEGGGTVEPRKPARPLIPRDDADSEGDAAGEERREIASVPLFGPTSLADEAAGEDSPPEPAQALSRAKVADQSFDEASPAKPRTQARASIEFSRGRLRLPIVYRLRLDRAGASLRGESTPMGFDVVIPGRKLMESPAAITRRDKRIAKVVTRNGQDGTRISFRFKSGIPAYKVRLREDYVEFFISSS